MVDLIVWAVSIGAAVCILLGFGLGVIGDDAAKKRTKRRAVRLAKDLREERGARQRAEDRATRATSQRDDYRRQLDAATAALERATYTNAVPAPDGDLEALVRVVTDEDPDDTPPRGAHHRPEPGPCQSLTSDPFAPESPEMYCEHDDGGGHTGDHTAYDGDVRWDDEMGAMWVRGERL
ncbi:hypothetical protein [Nocardiopsis synnemataformans]|uniref:hypothetical protein n=1 Tax=Nocardiopsis synnemataformans TaxID=61305 RepID=UPI003EB8C871